MPSTPLAPAPSTPIGTGSCSRRASASSSWKAPERQLPAVPRRKGRNHGRPPPRPPPTPTATAPPAPRTRRSALSPAAIDHINAHVTCTGINERIEARLQNQIFPASPPVTATKASSCAPTAGGGIRSEPPGIPMAARTRRLTSAGWSSVTARVARLAGRSSSRAGGRFLSLPERTGCAGGGPAARVDGDGSLVASAAWPDAGQAACARALPVQLALAPHCIDRGRAGVRGPGADGLVRRASCGLSGR